MAIYNVVKNWKFSIFNLKLPNGMMNLVMIYMQLFLNQDAPPLGKADEIARSEPCLKLLHWTGRGYGGGLGKTPRQGYVCHRCKQPGHFIQHCPTNGDPNFNIKKIKQPTGIPRSMLMATSNGSSDLPSGGGVLRPNEYVATSSLASLGYF